MAAIVVPFRGSGAKARLVPLPARARGELAHAMLGDVVAACTPVARTVVVTDDPGAAGLARVLGAQTFSDAGGGQGAAVAAALARVRDEPILVVNADLPCARPADLWSLLHAAPADGVALVEARDGTTNALRLPSPTAFAPLYGPRSAERFRVHACELGMPFAAASNPNLRDDVDTVADLEAVGRRAGPRTQAAISLLGLAA